jgi:integrase
MEVNKGDNLDGEGITGTAVGLIVHGVAREILGEDVNLSPHDCRHYWATKRAEEGATALQLMKEGGWSSLATVMIYIHEAS